MFIKGLVTNYGEGGLQNERGGAKLSFIPTKRGGGGKSFSHVEREGGGGGHKKFREVVLTREHEVLVIVMEGGGVGVQKVSTL